MFNILGKAKISLMSDIIHYMMVVAGLAMYLFTQSLISLVFVLMIIVFRYDTIYSFLLIFPVIEGLVIVGGGMTISRFIILIYLSKSALNILTHKNRIRIDGNGIALILLLLVIVMGLFNIVLRPYELFIGNIKFGETVFFTILTVSKILTAFMLYIEFRSKRENELKHLIKKVGVSITLSLLIIAGYTVLNPKTLYSGVDMLRRTIEETDPNELASFLVAFLPYPIYLLFHERVFLKFISIPAIFITTAVMALTLSRGGIVTFIILMMIIAMILIRNTQRKPRYIISMFIMIVLFYAINELTFSATLSRFTEGYSTQGMQGLTSNRWELWINGIQKTLAHRPFLGFGTSIKATQLLNYLITGRNNVMHSVLIGFFVQYGLTGLLVYLYMLYRFFKGFLYLVRKDHFLYLLPMLSLISLQISGLTLELEYRELMWIFIGISLGIISNVIDREKWRSDENYSSD